MNTFFSSIFSSTGHSHIPILLLVGSIIIIGYYFGKSTKILKLPSLIGYMLVGLIMGPSLLNIIDHNIQTNLSFITEIALGFVALSIGLELSFPSLKKQGIGIISIIIAESFAAFIITTIGVYLLTKDLPLSLVLGSFAPASAPAGTVAIIKEYKTKGSLTKALYAVVGFDDGLAIIIFGFVAATARMLLNNQTGSVNIDFFNALITPVIEVVLSLLIGLITAFVISLLARRIKNKQELLIFIVGFILIANGLCTVFHLSLILTNMVIGLIIVNTQKYELTHKIGEVLSEVLPLFFVLFFALAGANLHISALPALGLLGMTYIICRSAGLMGGAFLGGMVGNVEPKVKKYIGMGILSQAGVAIGLALIVKHEFQGLGKVVNIVNGVPIHAGDIIGSVGITMITATCIFFEIIGPILTKIALSKAGEIQEY